MGSKRGGLPQGRRRGQRSHKRAALIHLGGFWLSLAHAPPAQIDGVVAARIAAMERLQAELLGTPPTLH